MLRKQIDYTASQHSKESENISAVHDDDLEEFLQSIGVLHDIQKNLVKCKFCGITVNMHNLQSVFPDSGAISFVCDKQPCIRQFMTYYRGLNAVRTSA